MRYKQLYAYSSSRIGGDQIVVPADHSTETWVYAFYPESVLSSHKINQDQENDKKQFKKTHNETHKDVSIEHYNLVFPAHPFHGVLQTN
jgi:hypothetical protein